MAACSAACWQYCPQKHFPPCRLCILASMHGIRQSCVRVSTQKSCKGDGHPVCLLCSSAYAFLPDPGSQVLLPGLYVLSLSALSLSALPQLYAVPAPPVHAHVPVLSPVSAGLWCAFCLQRPYLSLYHICQDTRWIHFFSRRPHSSALFLALPGPVSALFLQVPLRTLSSRVPYSIIPRNVLFLNTYAVFEIMPMLCSSAIHHSPICSNLKPCAPALSFTLPASLWQQRCCLHGLHTVLPSCEHQEHHVPAMVLQCFCTPANMNTEMSYAGTAHTVHCCNGMPGYCILQGRIEAG